MLLLWLCILQFMIVNDQLCIPLCLSPSTILHFQKNGISYLRGGVLVATWFHKVVMSPILCNVCCVYYFGVCRYFNTLFPVTSCMLCCGIHLHLFGPTVSIIKPVTKLSHLVLYNYICKPVFKLQYYCSVLYTVNAKDGLCKESFEAICYWRFGG
jgi:hypothetical protein